MSYNPNNANGQATMANSAPVVLPSNQSAIPVSESGTWTVQPGNTANTTPWLAQPHDGTQGANTFAGDSGQNGLVVVGSRKDSGSTALSTSNYGAIDVSNYSWVTVQCTAYTSGTLTWQCSNDNSTWVGLPLTAANALVSTATPQVLTAAATGMWHGPLTARYFRVTGGVATIYVSFFSVPRSSLFTSSFLSSTTSTIGVGGCGNKTNNNAAPGATNISAMPAIANAAAQTWSEGNAVLASVDLAGNMRVAQMAAATGGYSYSYNNSNSASAVVVKNAAGFLHAVTINKKGASSNLLTLYDNASTNSGPFAVIDTTVTFGTLIYDLAFANGLSIVLNTGTAADLTITYK